jgi:hypothetical protein
VEHLRAAAPAPVEDWREEVIAEHNGETSACDKCGAEYPSAPTGTIHKCGRCSGGYCSRLEYEKRKAAGKTLSPSVRHYGEPDIHARVWHWAEQTEDGSELTGRTGTARGVGELEALDRLRLDHPEIGRIKWTKTEKPDATEERAGNWSLMNIGPRQDRRNDPRAAREDGRNGVRNGCTEAEAIAAAAKAAQMLERYNLTVDEVQMRETPFAKHAEQHDDEVGARLWKVADGIAHMTGARYWTTPPGCRVEISFFGFEHEVEIARYLLDICARAMRQEERRLNRVHGLLVPRKRRMIILPFLDGMSDRLRDGSAR